jgi:hypothetical protein
MSVFKYETDEGAIRKVGAMSVFKYQGLLDVCLFHVGK